VRLAALLWVPQVAAQVVAGKKEGSMAQYIGFAGGGQSQADSAQQMFDYLARGLYHRQARKDRLAQEKTENDLRDRQLKLSEEDNKIRRELLAQQLAGLKLTQGQTAKAEHLSGFDPNSTVNQFFQPDEFGRSLGATGPGVVTQDAQGNPSWRSFNLRKDSFENLPEDVQRAVVGEFQKNAPEGTVISPADVAAAMRSRQLILQPPVIPPGLTASEMEATDAAGRKIKYERNLPMVEEDILNAKGEPSGFVRIGKEVRPQSMTAKLTEGDKALQVNTKELRTNLKQLKDVIADFGNFELGVPGVIASNTKGAKSGLTSNQAAGLLKSLPYRAAIGYAKVVDPATAAREGEVSAATKFAIPMGFGTPNEVTLAALDSMLTELDRREKANTELREQQGLPPVSLSDGVKPPGELPKFDSVEAADAAAKAAGWPAGTKLLVFVPAKGKYMEAEVE
jgi:hypothetical protein